MMRVALGALAILVVQALGNVVPSNTVPKVVNHVTLQRQIDLSGLFNHITEPLKDPELRTIAETWDLEKNIEQFNNVTAVKDFLLIQEYEMFMPRFVPFKLNDRAIYFEIKTIFNLLISAKDYSTFYKTAVYLRERVNEGVFVYVLSIAIMRHPETQDVIVPPIYEVFPMYFHNAEIMNIAQRVNVHGKQFVKNYPQTFVWDDNVVIRWNTTAWPYVDEEDAPISYYLNDHALSTLNFNNNLRNQFWFNDNKVPSLNMNKWGAFNWFFNKQYVTRYYMERLSNGLGEIPLMNWDVITQGYSSGLVHFNGVPFPVRPDYFKLEQPKLYKHVEQLKQYESRIRDAIEAGYIITTSGDKINLRDPEAIGVLMNVVEGNVRSPNTIYYGSILNAWKGLLGNSIVSSNVWWKGHIPLVVPSALDLSVTELRDPAFYMIWKRISNLFTLWQSYLPRYNQEELALPEVKIEKVEVDKLVTYFERSYLNVTNALPQNEVESKGAVSVLVQRPQLNNKVFKVRVNVKSEVPKTVVVRFFLAPKYNSKGLEIPLHVNTENFFQIDQFVYELPAGETVIKRESTSNKYMIDKWWSCTEITTKAVNALHDNSQFVVDQNQLSVGFPRHLMLPKGRVGGMPFQFLVFINEYKASPEPSGTYAGLAALHTTNEPWGYPLDRPLYEWQIQKLTNIHIDEVQIYHKPTPEIVVPFEM